MNAQTHGNRTTHINRSKASAHGIAVIYGDWPHVLTSFLLEAFDMYIRHFNCTYDPDQRCLIIPVQFSQDFKADPSVRFFLDNQGKVEGKLIMQPQHLPQSSIGGLPLTLPATRLDDVQSEIVYALFDVEG